MTSSRFFFGVDLGQSNDPSTIAVVERIGDQFRCGHLERMPLGTSYPSVVHRVGSLMAAPICAGNCELAIDATGVGRPVCDMFTHAGIPFIGVIITAGHAETIGSADCYRNVPKISLISHVQSLLHGGRLKIKKDLPEADTLINELKHFKVSYSSAGFMSFSARDGKHDDLVLALSVAVWCAQRTKTGQESWDDFLKQKERHAVAEGFDRDDIRVSGPEFGFRYEDQATLTLRLPDDLNSSHIVLPDGKTKLVDCDRAGRRTIDVCEDHARILLNSGTQDSAKWFEANTSIATKIGKPPPSPPGVRVTDVLDAAESQQSRHPLDKANISRDTLRMIGRKV
jgi:hypothetical protein